MNVIINQVNYGFNRRKEFCNKLIGEWLGTHYILI